MLPEQVSEITVGGTVDWHWQGRVGVEEDLNQGDYNGNLPHNQDSLRKRPKCLTQFGSAQDPSGKSN